MLGKLDFPKFNIWTIETFEKDVDLPNPILTPPTPHHIHNYPSPPPDPTRFPYPLIQVPDLWTSGSTCLSHASDVARLVSYLRHGVPERLQFLCFLSEKNIGAERFDIPSADMTSASAASAHVNSAMRLLGCVAMWSEILIYMFI